MQPLECLRSVASRALRMSRPDRPVYPMSFGLMATANAFVMLGLVPEAEAEEILAAHRLDLEAKGFPSRWGVTDGELTLRPGAHGYWQARPSGQDDRPNEPGADGSVVRAGTGIPAWPTPAESYLAELATMTTSYSIGTGERSAEFDSGQLAEIVATVADSLISVGALPVTSKLLQEPADNRPRWQSSLPRRWYFRTRQQDEDDAGAQHYRLDARLPFDHAAVTITNVTRLSELVSIQMIGRPWIDGEYWPMITPCFRVRATDNSGGEHQGMPGDRSRSLSAPATGNGTFWFWPPIETSCRDIRVSVSTLWESAWVDLELPRLELPR